MMWKNLYFWSVKINNLRTAQVSLLQTQIWSEKICLQVLQGTFGHFNTFLSGGGGSLIQIIYCDSPCVTEGEQRHREHWGRDPNVDTKLPSKWFINKNNHNPKEEPRHGENTRNRETLHIPKRPDGEQR